MAYFTPHTLEWFKALGAINSLQAAATKQILDLAGKPDVCGNCGDAPANDYVVVGVKFDLKTDATIRLCSDCRDIRSKMHGESFSHLNSKTPDLKTAAQRAETTIKTQWKTVAKYYTVGWMGPIEVVEAQYSHISQSIATIKNNISYNLPIVIFQSRESPPKSIITAIPYKNLDGNPYNCRLAITSKLSQEKVRLLNDFSQAFWFLIDNELLPSPRSGDELERKIIEWCGKSLIRC